MTFDGALITEQGVTFGLVVVKPYVLSSPAEESSMRTFGARAFGRVPIVLVAQDSKGTPTYSGRRDIVQFLANINHTRIPWKRYTINAA